MFFCFPNDTIFQENLFYIVTISIVRNKIGRHDPQQCFKNFKEYITGEHKGKTSANCKLFQETLWHLRHATSNYRSRTGFQWKFERIGVELNRVGVGVEIQKVRVEI